MSRQDHRIRTFEPALMGRAAIDSLKRLTPMAQWRNPVMFVTWIGCVPDRGPRNVVTRTDSPARFRSGCG